MREERRKNYRYPPTAGSETVVLRKDGVEHSATLINFSAEGFRLGLDVVPNVESTIQVGDLAILSTGHGSHRVRVANVETAEQKLFIGLERLAEIAPQARGREERSPGRDGTTKGRRYDNPFSSPLVQCSVLVGIAAAVLVLINLNPSTPDKLVGTASAARQRVVRSRETGEGGSSGRPSTNAVEGRTSRSKQAGQWPKSSGEKRLAARRGASSGQFLGNTSVTANGKSLSPSNSGAARETGGRSDSNGSPPQDVTAAPQGAGALFDPGSDATVTIAAALKTAGRQNKRVLLEFGTNQCEACYRLHRAFTGNAEVAATLQKAFVLVPVDFGANQKLFARFAPDEVRPRIPFLTLLDHDGKVLKNQPSDELEDGSAFDAGKLKAFLEQSSPST